MVHEIGHAIGFWHQQSRSDRDGYVSIIESNIQSNPLQSGQFAIASPAETLGVDYDYGSIMHYGPNVSIHRCCLIPYPLHCWQTVADSSLLLSHFPSQDFAIDSSKYTIVTTDPLYQRTIGQRVGLSWYDARVANTAYCSGENNIVLDYGYRRPNQANNHFYLVPEFQTFALPSWLVRTMGTLTPLTVANVDAQKVWEEPCALNLS